MLGPLPVQVYVWLAIPFTEYPSAHVTVTRCAVEPANDATTPLVLSSAVTGQATAVEEE